MRLREALVFWTERLGDTPSPNYDARALVAHVLGVSINQLVLIDDVSDEDFVTIDALVTRRSRREPLQHLTGTAPFLDLELVVGPGVFIPRPETESLAEYACIWLAQREPGQVVVELFAGSAAISFAVATHVARAQVVAMELSEAALGYAPENHARLLERMERLGSGVEFRRGDATVLAAVSDLAGRVDAVLLNPPYIPDEAVPREPEVADHDPAEALYGGPDGLAVVTPAITVAARLLKPGGLVAIEHGDDQGGQTGMPGLLAAAAIDDRPVFAEIQDHRDLGDRPRYTTGLRLP